MCHLTEAGWYSLHKVAFLDRDGLINVRAAEHDYIKNRSEFAFLPGACEAIRLLNENEYLVIIVTNQRGIARKIMTVEDLESIHAYMNVCLNEHGAHTDAVYVCPHDNGECNCRKPDIGLFLQAQRDFPIDKSRSFMIGDSQSDVDAGERYGIRSYKTQDLLTTVQRILSEEQTKRK
ncbi:MAG: HAD family hydrolase [Ruminococcaceae bacterium]|nr:HAD family hydrolase [Oscillospiraceae bacterium]